MLTTLDFPTLVAKAQASELPALIGQLEAAKAAALLRLVMEERSPELSDDRLLTMPEVAEALAITEHRAREMGRRGELPVITVGTRGVRVRAAALAEWTRRRERR